MRLVPLLTAVLIAAGLYYWFELRHAPADEAVAMRAEIAAESAPINDAASSPVPVMVLESSARETSAEIVLRGRTEALRDVDVAAETTGRVVSEPLRQGTTVEAGQVLCRLDPGARAAELAEVEAALEEAEIQAAATDQLQARGYAPETQLKERQARLRAAQARLDQVRLDIDRLEIRAPFDGILQSDTAELGTLLVPGSLCATVVDLSQVKVIGYVSEQEVGQLAVGQEARARLITGEEATGEITFISRMGDEQTRTYLVEVILPNPDRSIRDGMTAELRVALPPATAHFVPQSALTLDDDGRLGVRTAEDGVAVFHPVTILRDAVDGVWIAGLPERADIIVVGQEFVRAGREVAATPVAAEALQ